jgi:hypothetical protein
MGEFNSSFTERLKSEVRDLRLTHAEKSAMRVRLFDVMYPAAQPSPFVYISRFSMVFTAVIFLLIGSGSYTAFAAQKALPGDPLYPVKVNVNETVEGALALSASSKAQWHANVAQRRVAEAEVLASQGKLSAAAATQISTNLTDHAEQAQALTSVIAVTDPGTATQISTELSSALDAHEEVLAQIGSTSTSTENKDNTDKLAADVHGFALAMAQVDARIELTEGDSASSTATSTGRTVAMVASGTPAALPKARTFGASAPRTISSTSATSSSTTIATASPAAVVSQQTAPAPTVATSTSKDMATAVQLKASAVSQLALARANFATAKPSLATSTKTNLQAKFAAADVLVVQASAALQAGNASLAIKNYTQVLKISSYITTYLAASKQLTPAVVSPILDKQDAQDNQDQGDNSDSGNTKKSGEDKGVLNKVLHLDL